MAIFVGFLIFMVIAFVVAANQNQNRSSQWNDSLGGGFGGMSSLRSGGGTPARGIMLSVSSTGSRTTYNGLRYEVRNATVDIEIAGYAPYESNTSVYIPSNLVRDVLPGSTMELRVDSTDRSMVVVVGPDVGFAQGAVKTS